MFPLCQMQTVSQKPITPPKWSPAIWCVQDTLVLVKKTGKRPSNQKNWSISLESAADDRFNDEALINLIFSSISPRFLWFVAVKVIQVCTFFDENAFKLN